MKIHAIQTGTVAITTAWREGVGHGRRRLVHALADRNWTDPLPIYAFAIEHPEGVIIIDTGESARAAAPGYFPRWHPVFRLAVRVWVEPEQEIGPQLEQLGIGRSDVRRVVMTHLHTDHAGGLHHFPDTQILVARPEIEYASGFLGQLRGYPNARWPSWFDPTPVDFASENLGPFPHTVRLTKAGDIKLVALPGHSPGHMGVLIDESERSVLLAGDSSYTEELLLRGAIDGVGPDERGERLAQERIRAYARAHPTVYLVAHDPQTGNRLAKRQVVGQSAVETAARSTLQTRVEIDRPPAEPAAYVSPLRSPVSRHFALRSPDTSSVAEATADRDTGKARMRSSAEACFPREG